MLTSFVFASVKGSLDVNWGVITSSATFTISASIALLGLVMNLLGYSLETGWSCNVGTTVCIASYKIRLIIDLGLFLLVLEQLSFPLCEVSH